MWRAEPVHLSADLISPFFQISRLQILRVHLERDLRAKIEKSSFGRSMALAED